MKPIRIISVSGAIGSGKDTIADYLVEQHGFKKIAFADSLKDAMSIIFGFDRQLLEGATVESRLWRERVVPYWDDAIDTDQDVTPRWLLEQVATEIFRKFCPDIWVRSLELKLMLAQEEEQDVVIKDTRFINEMLMLHRRKALFWGTHRRQEDWVKPFYMALEKHDVWPDVDWTNSIIRSQVMHKIERALHDEHLSKLHRSKWEFLLWNKYHKMFNNTKSLSKLHAQIDKALVNGMR